MKQVTRILVFVFIALSAPHLHAQTAPLDTVFLMSGKILTGVVKDTSNERLKILVPRKKENTYKADFVDQELVFSVRYKNGTESVFYKQDTLFGNYYTPQEVRYFLQGERDARRSFHTPWCIAGAFAVGFASTYMRSTFMFIPPFAYAGLTVPFRIKIRPKSISNPDFLKYDTYLLGYEKEARKRRIFRSLIMGGIGLAAGITYQSLSN